MMKFDAINKYLDTLEEIKKRVAVIHRFQSGISRTAFPPTSIESIYLQFRKVLELIAFGSLIANKEIYSTMRSDVSRFRKPKLILEEIAKLNPDFYPKPIRQVPSTDPRAKMEFISKDKDTLTQRDFEVLFDDCNTVLHAENPYGTAIDWKQYEQRVAWWDTLIRNLLDSHTVLLIGDKNLYLYQMGSENEHPSFVPFQPTTL